eukprot:scaffold5218_cov150-Ochromonas_danica.AAC.3
MVLDLRIPLVANVLEGDIGIECETNEENVSLRVAKRTQTVIIFLSGRIPQANINRLGVHHDTGRIIVKDRGDILLRKGICGVTDQHAGLTHRTVTCNSRTTSPVKRQKLNQIIH